MYRLMTKHVSRDCSLLCVSATISPSRVNAEVPRRNDGSEFWYVSQARVGGLVLTQPVSSLQTTVRELNKSTRHLKTTEQKSRHILIDISVQLAESGATTSPQEICFSSLRHLDSSEHSTASSVKHWSEATAWRLRGRVWRRSLVDAGSFRERQVV
jgi:hypothetical protein